MNKSIAALCFVLLAGSAMALETKDVSEQGEGRLYFTGPGYTINLIPQAILLGILAFLAVYFLGIGEPGNFFQNFPQNFQLSPPKKSFFFYNFC